MPDDNLKVYSETEMPAKTQRTRPDRLVSRGRLAAAQVQHRRLADDADAGQRHRLPVRGGLAPRRPGGHVGQGLGQAQDALRRRNHRQGLRPGQEDRGGRPVAAAGRWPARGQAQQIRQGRLRFPGSRSAQSARVDRCLTSSRSCSTRRISRPAGTAATGPLATVGCTSSPTSAFGRPTSPFRWCWAFSSCVAKTFPSVASSYCSEHLFWRCGTTHLMEAIIFWWPVYRLAGLIKLFTALVSWGTVFALIRVAPRFLAMAQPRGVGAPNCHPPRGGRTHGVQASRSLSTRSSDRQNRSLGVEFADR